MIRKLTLHTCQRVVQRQYFQLVLQNKMPFVREKPAWNHRIQGLSEKKKKKKEDK